MVDEQIIVEDESTLKEVTIEGVMFAKNESKLEELEPFDKMPKLGMHPSSVKEYEYYVGNDDLSEEGFVRIFATITKVNFRDIKLLDIWYHSLFRKPKMIRKSRESYYEAPAQPPEPPPLPGQ